MTLLFFRSACDVKPVAYHLFFSYANQWIADSFFLAFFFSVGEIENDPFLLSVRMALQG